MNFLRKFIKKFSLKWKLLQMFLSLTDPDCICYNRHSKYSKFQWKNDIEQNFDMNIFDHIQHTPIKIFISGKQSSSSLTIMFGTSIVSMATISRVCILQVIYIWACGKVNNITHTLQHWKKLSTMKLIWNAANERHQNSIFWYVVILLKGVGMKC